MQQRCRHASASARSPSWPPMPRPRLQRAATARREKVQLRIREQSFFPRVCGKCGRVCASVCVCTCVWGAGVRVSVCVCVCACAGGSGGAWVVRVRVWVGGGGGVCQIKSKSKSNQIKTKINQSKSKHQRSQLPPSALTRAPSALTRAPERTLIHQKDRKICEVRVPPSALMPESTLIHQIGFTRTNCAWITLNLFAAEVPQRAPCSSSHHPLSLNSWPPTTPPHRTRPL